MFELSQQTGAVLAIAHLRRLDALAAPEARRDLEAAAHDTPVLIVDLGATTFCDSSGIGTLVAALKALPPGGQLRLTGVCDQIQSALRATRLDRVFRTFASVEEAARG